MDTHEEDVEKRVSDQHVADFESLIIYLGQLEYNIIESTAQLEALHEEKDRTMAKLRRLRNAIDVGEE